MDVQTEALRRKNAGDPRPLPEIIAELSGGAPQGGAMVVAPTPAAPVPVGEPVEVQAPAPVAAVPPMSTPYAQVDKARTAAQPGASAGVSATDVAVASAAQQGKPEADLLARVRARQAEALRSEEERMAELRASAKVDPRMEEMFRRREERYAREEADIAKDEKKQAWNALAMAGFKMAQSTSPYFLSALTAGLESGFEGFNAAKAAAAEKKARLLDAREGVQLSRIQAESSAADRMMADRNAAMTAVMREQDAIAKGLEVEMANELNPLRKEQLKVQIQQVRANIANDAARLGLAYRADARAGAAAARAARGGGGDPLAKARGAALAAADKYGRDFAEKALESQGITPDDPSYSAAFERAAGQGADIWLNTNRQAKALLGAGAPTINAPPPPPAPKKEEKGWFSGWFD